MIELAGSFGGSHIASVCKDAVALANGSNDNVHFVFNGADVIVSPGENADAVQKRWSATMDANHLALINSPEYKTREAERQAEELRKRTASLKETAQTESELREAQSPWPYTPEQLSEYIASLVDRTHDYGTCVYAMSLAATAAFNYVAHALGTTGFQSSCADLDFIRRTRSIDGPFMLLKAADALYPQYDLTERLRTAMQEWEPWLKEQAAKKLQEVGHAHPDVVSHWKKLATA